MILVLVVDDSAFVRQALSRMLGAAPDIEVVGTAVDGKDGWEKALDLRPDVVTLDVKMPRMDGLEALRRIMADCPTAVLLLSSQTKEGAEVTLRGLELGAMDFVDKSRVQGHMNLLGLAEELQTKIRALASVPRARLQAPTAVRETGPKVLPAQHAARAQIVVIGTSTGGPPALQAIIPRLPEALPCAVLVVQHMPVGFTRSLAERLDGRSVVPVREAADGDLVVRGSVLVAPAGRHMKIRRRGQETRGWLDHQPRPPPDLPLLDILQIVSFSKKTGYLSIRTEAGEGAIVFTDGFVVAAFSAETPPFDPRYRHLPPEARTPLLRQSIEGGLAQLIRLREGQFSFSLTEQPPLRIGPRDISEETLPEGINAQELLLDLARGMDEDRRDSTAALEASFAEPPVDVGGAEALVDLPPAAPVPATAVRSSAPSAPPPPADTAARASVPPPSEGEASTILLVDDEDEVRRILAERFARGGDTRVADPPPAPAGRR